jgi:hypothetical protein
MSTGNAYDPNWLNVEFGRIGSGETRTSRSRTYHSSVVHGDYIYVSVDLSRSFCRLYSEKQFYVNGKKRKLVRIDTRDYSFETDFFDDDNEDFYDEVLGPDSNVEIYIDCGLMIIISMLQVEI